MVSFNPSFEERISYVTSSVVSNYCHCKNNGINIVLQRSVGDAKYFFSVVPQQLMCI